MSCDESTIWIFGFGSLIWWTGEVVPVERREGILAGWHREWTWISSTRHDALTCKSGAGRAGADLEAMAVENRVVSPYDGVRYDKGLIKSPCKALERLSDLTRWYM